MYQLDKNKANTIHYYLARNNENLVNYLFEKEFIPLELNQDKKDDYLLAALHGDNVNYLKNLHARGVNLKGVNKQGRNLLFLVANYSPNCTRYLVNDIGLDINLEYTQGNTILNYLASDENLSIESENKHEAEETFSRYEMIKLLLDLGANPNIQCDRGYTPLFWALSKDLYDMCELLVLNGASPEIKVKSGNTAFAYAAAKSDLKYIKLFMPYITDINMRVKNATTALMTACYIDPMLSIGGVTSYDKVEFLLNNGADKTLVSDAGKTALEYAEGQYNVQELLLRHGTDDIILPFIDAWDILQDMSPKEIYDLSKIPHNHKIIDENFKNFFKEIKVFLKKGDIDNVRNAALNLSELIPKPFIEQQDEYKDMYNYLNEIVEHTFKVTKIHELQKPENHSLKSYIEYYNLVSNAYLNNDDLWWSSYIAFCINFAYYLDNKEYKECSFFAIEAIELIEERDISSSMEADINILNQFKQQLSNLHIFINKSTTYTNKLLDEEIVKNNGSLYNYLKDTSNEDTYKNIDAMGNSNEFEYVQMSTDEFAHIFNQLISYSLEDIESTSNNSYDQKKLLHNFFMNLCNSTVAYINDNDYAQANTGFKFIENRIPSSFFTENRMLKKSFDEIDQHLQSQLLDAEEEIPF